MPGSSRRCLGGRGRGFAVSVYKAEGDILFEESVQANPRLNLGIGLDTSSVLLRLSGRNDLIYLGPCAALATRSATVTFSFVSLESSKASRDVFGSVLSTTLTTVAMLATILTGVGATTIIPVDTCDVSTFRIVRQNCRGARPLRRCVGSVEHLSE